MTPWQIALERQLSGADAPGVLTLGAIARAAEIHRGSPIANSSLQHWIKGAAERGRLQRVYKGLYLNAFRSPPGRLLEAAPHLRRDAVISLHSALAEAGAINNPPRVVTAVVPIDAGAPPPSLGTVRTPKGIFSFRGLPRRVLEAGKIEDRLDTVRHQDVPCATPEKALLDWLYLAASPRSDLTVPARHDIDVGALDKKRLQRLAEAASTRVLLEAWLAPTPKKKTATERRRTR